MRGEAGGDRKTGRGKIKRKGRQGRKGGEFPAAPAGAGSLFVSNPVAWAAGLSLISGIPPRFFRMSCGRSRSASDGSTGLLS